MFDLVLKEKRCLVKLFLANLRVGEVIDCFSCNTNWVSLIYTCGYICYSPSIVFDVPVEAWELRSVRVYRVWLCCDGSIDGSIALDDGSIVLCRLNRWFENEGWLVCWW